MSNITLIPFEYHEKPFLELFGVMGIAQKPKNTLK